MPDLPRLGIRFEGHEPVDEMIVHAQEAERCGASSVWITQHLGRRDPIVAAALLAATTTRVQIGIQNLTPFINHSLVAAMQLATLAEASGGRIVVSFGIGNALDLGRAGISVENGEQTLAQAVMAVRQLLAGEPCHDAVGKMTFNGARLSAPRQAQIMLSVLHPGLAALARGLGAGLQLSAGLSAAMAAKCAAAGGGAEIAAFAYFGTTAKVSLEALRRKLAYLFRNALLADNISESGLGIDQARLIKEIARGNIEGAAQMLPDAALKIFAIAGDERAQIGALETFAQSNIGEIVIDLGSGPDDRDAAFSLLRQVQP